MNWTDYQSFVKSSKKYDDRFRLLYPVLGLTSEAGEVSGKLKKIFRDHNGEISDEQRSKLIDEISDVLWYVTACVDDLDFTLEELAEYNYTKISGRLRDNTIHGDGDVR